MASRDPAYRLRILRPIEQGLKARATMEPLLLNQILEVLLDIRELLLDSDQENVGDRAVKGAGQL